MATATRDPQRAARPAGRAPARPPKTHPRMELAYVHPDEVVLGKNPRGKVRIDRDMKASMADVGLLQPLVGLRFAEPPTDQERQQGELRPWIRIRIGKRRLAHVRAARLTEIGVLIAGDERTDDPADLERILQQLAENRHRQDFNAAETAAAVQEMLDLGIDENQITQRAHLTSPEIAAARKVAASETARSAAERHTAMTLDQTAALAGFEAADDTEAVSALLASADAGDGKFDHVAQQMHNSQAERRQKTALIAELNQAGVPVIIGWVDYTNQLEYWNVSPGDKTQLTPDNHAACPGHAANVRSTGHRNAPWQATYMCTNPEKNGHERHRSSSGKPRAADLPPDQRLAEAFRLNWTKAGNREARAARTIRMTWLREFAPRPRPPEETLDLMAWYFTTSGYELRTAGERGHMLACDLLGVEVTSDKDYTGWGERLAALQAARDAAAPDRRVMIGLVCLLAAQEKNLGDGTTVWDSSDTEWPHRKMCACYLAFLEALGYPLSPIEAHLVRGTGRYTPIEMEGITPPGGAPMAGVPGAASPSCPGHSVQPAEEEGRYCILTDTSSDDPDDHGSRAHEYGPATQAEPGHDQPGIHDQAAGPASGADDDPQAAPAPDAMAAEPATGSAAYAGDDAESQVG